MVTVMVTFSGLRGQERPDLTPTLFDVPPVVRTFDTPEFNGVTFYEVEAKSLLNRVPAGERFPFRWTVNVYRGCGHACRYCQSGDTPILMADGRTRPLAEVRVGDAVFGTLFDGKYRRYTITQVLAHWSTVKRAYRVTLEDGTTLVASGDHRFLTATRGWRHVTGSEQGRDRRPHLTPSDKLLGTGQFAAPPKDGPEYRRGYLCGMIRGDAHLGSRTYRRPNGTQATFHTFRFALVDAEALQRTRGYLTDLGIPTTERVFQVATATRKQLDAISSGSRAGLSAIMELVAWPTEPSADWCKGFLAGIFDAEGSYDDNGALRICNTDQAIVDRITSCLRRFGFSFVIEERRRSSAKPVTYVRLLGGFREHLRFFHTVDPAITRKRRIAGRAIKHDAPLRVVAVEPLGIEVLMFDITTGTSDFIADGVVSHNCFARPSHTWLGFDAGRDFETRIVVKVNAPEILRHELKRPSWRGEHVAMGTNTDPYQRCEGRYRLTRAVLEAFRDFRNPCSVLTKSPLLLRDLDLMVELDRTAGFSANLSIGTLDEDVWRRSEPGTPHPRARVAAVRELRAAGIPCGVLVAPVLPGISDHPDQLKAVVEAVAEAGATSITPITLHLRPGVREEFMPWLEREHPGLVGRYRRLYRSSNAPPAVRERIARQARAAAGRPGPRARGRLAPEEAGGSRAPDGRRIGDSGSDPAPTPQQLGLDLQLQPGRRPPRGVGARREGPGHQPPQL